MSTTSLLIANPQGIYFGDSSADISVSPSTNADLTELQGALDDATITEEDVETTEYAALIGSSNIYIRKTLGSLVLELTLAEIYPTQFEELTGYKYTASTTSAVGTLKRPTSAPTIDKMIVIEFEGGVCAIFHKADLYAKMADMDVKTGLMSFTLTCTAQDFINSDGSRENYTLATPMLVSE